MPLHLRFLVGWMLLLCPPCASAAEPGALSGDVTVLLFQTEAVQTLQVRAREAGLRLCKACAEQHGPVSLDLHAQDDIMLDAHGKPLHTVALKGEISVLTGGNHRATAAGKWSIHAAHHQLVVQVMISRERYVEGVLAAEAGPNEPQEFLKAMAVTARSFAAAASARHADGTFCDTTHCQALRLEPVSQSLRDAVWDTSGETLWFADKRAVAYFSQHCGGVTEDASSAWGGSSLPWLSSHVDAWCARMPSQWRASIAASDVQRALALEGYSSTGPIQEIAASARDRSGRVEQVRVRDAGSTRRISAATLRFALNRSLGWNQLRSDRYQVRRIGDRIVFEGSGFGHGVGLCQAGAIAMARSGKNYREILHTYFPGTVVRLRAHDLGWRTITANGFLFRSTAQDGFVERHAAQGFADARYRWSVPVTANPSLTVFPTTESFRQATGRPGWDLAVTKGARTGTQPADVLNAHGGARAAFRHEFLHSFVEAQAKPASPLWLREGLVTALNEDVCTAGDFRSADEVSVALRTAVTLAQSQRAHAAACAWTKHFITEHGLAAARALLQNP